MSGNVTQISSSIILRTSPASVEAGLKRRVEMEYIGLNHKNSSVNFYIEVVNDDLYKIGGHVTL